MPNNEKIFCREIRAVYTENTVRVYQAFAPRIAEEAVAKGTFGKHFKMDRMTWIKPSFLWMMYRSDWGKKENQERILAIDIKREAFNYIVAKAVSTKYEESSGITESEWRNQLSQSDIRCQWDPERDINGEPLKYRSIQLGIKGNTLFRYVNEWIVRISDITKYVNEVNERRERGENVCFLLPEEKRYDIKKAYKEN